MQRLAKQNVPFTRALRTRTSLTPATASPRRASRRGSVLLVVIGLLLVLLLLGMTFFTFATQEDISAQYFSESAKVYTASIDVDAMWDWALRHLIVGPNQNEQNSALWAPQSNAAASPNFYLPHRWSLLAGIYGTDFAPYSGAGIHLIAIDTNNDGKPDRAYVDQNYDGRPDGNPAGIPAAYQGDTFGSQSLLDINFSPAAQGVASNSGGFALPPTSADPDVDYTYPDINNLFLAYRGFAQNANGNSFQVVIPSFLRPQLLRTSNGMISDWYENTAAGTNMRRRMFRPHPSHVIANLPAYTRFLKYGKDNQPGVAGVDDNGDGTIDNAIEEGWPGSDDFPFRVDRNLNGTRGEMGVFYNAASGISGGSAGALLIDFDKDNDGDGIPDGVLIDLGYPASQLADGTWFIPMFSFTIYDADALVNMNIAANIMGLHSASGGADSLVSNTTQAFGFDPVTNGPYFISRSNQGLAPSEINPGWLLDTDPNTPADFKSGNPATDLDQLRRYYGNNPATRVELANMELYNALAGRPNYDSSGTITEYLVGRWGEEQRLKDGVLGKAPSPARTLALYPGPGTAGVDDDLDRLDGESPPDTLPFRHPLDFSGAGTFLHRPTNIDSSGDQFGRIPLLLAAAPVPNPSVWLGYAGYHSTNTIPYFAQTAGYNLMLTRDRGAPMSASNWLLDHPMETIVDLQAKDKLNPLDEIFGIEEMEGLQRNPNDPDYSLVVSRLQQLMLVNLQLSSRAAQIRERMTVESWDRKEFNLPHNSTLRTWEFNANINNTGAGAGKPEFPPVCVSSAGQLQSDEPIRPELRRWLEIEEGNVSSTRPQQRWNVNKFISSATNDQLGWPTTPTNIAGSYLNLSVSGTGNAQLYQRNLTPHPTSVDLGNSPITAPSASATNATTPNDLEYWARRDRQQMARDIYVMLYLFGGGMDFEVDLNGNGMLDPGEDINGNGQWDDVNYATTPNTPLVMGGPRRLYTEAQCRQMAQFAVNFVDAIDRDTVITKFEFDLDLSNGWNLDDNPFGTTGDTGDYNATTNPTGERMVVYGVEAQQMAFSEALVVRAQQVTDAMGNAVDHVATEFNDRQERIYSYIELQNVSPFMANLNANAGNAANRGHWQIAVMDQNSPANQVRELELRRGSVNPGATFTIGSRSYFDSEPNDKDSSGNPIPSGFGLDPNWVAGAPVQPWPYVVSGGTSLNLDLVDNVNDTYYRLSNSLGGGNVLSDGFGAVWGSGVTLNPTVPSERGKFLDSIIVPPTAQFVTFKLRRRLNPTREMPIPNSPNYIQQEQDNPWVDVDEIVVNVRNFSLRDTDKAPEIQTQLTSLQSRERYQPLDGRANALTDHSPASAGTAWRAHSIGSPINQATQNMGGSFTLWQPHFDRDLATIPELFSIPLYGPSQTRFLLPTGNAASGAKLALVDSSNEALVASEVILRPQHPANLLVVPPAVADPKLDNRWYRLLELMEVTSRAHRNVAIASPRVPGKINLNTVRHTSVLGALLDDPYLLNYSTLASLDTNDNDGTNVRNWWNQFIRSRDQYDDLSQLFLPGMANSRPFRSLQYATADGPVADVEHTVLRGLPNDLNVLVNPGEGPGQARRLFEVGTFNNHTNVTDANYTDAYTRHRLLSKIYGNTTTRSHVFYVWVSVDFHEAIEVPGVSDPITNEKAFQIGGKIPGLQGHRMFAVIDRSQAELLLNPNNPAQPFNLANWKKMQLFRRTIE
jgi:hypothetical protein